MAVRLAWGASYYFIKKRKKNKHKVYVYILKIEQQFNYKSICYVMDLLMS